MHTTICESSHSKLKESYFTSCLQSKWLSCCIIRTILMTLWRSVTHASDMESLYLLLSNLQPVIMTYRGVCLKLSLRSWWPGAYERNGFMGGG